MKVLFKDVEKPIHQMVIPNDLSVMQQLVGGLIEPVYLTAESAMICNEEGKIKDMDANFYFEETEDIIYGPVLFVGVDGEEFCDLSDEEIAHIRKCFEEAADE